MRYTTHGAVRGRCGHEHRTIQAALKCLARDIRQCQSVGGYSDRYVYLVADDGSLVIFRGSPA